MQIEKIHWKVDHGPDKDFHDLVRDPYVVGNFLCGILCNEKGIAIRIEGCTGSEVRIRLDRIVSRTPFEPVPRED